MKEKFFETVRSVRNHVFFSYKGIECGIEPINSSRFEITFGDKLFIANDFDELKNSKYFDGKSLDEIFDSITDAEF